MRLAIVSFAEQSHDGEAHAKMPRRPDLFRAPAMMDMKRIDIATIAAARRG